MKAIRSFWRHLLHRDVAFVTLSSAFHQMDLTEAKADKVYRSVLERYPKSVKLLRIYGRFLEDVKNDPVSSRAGNRFIYNFKGASVEKCRVVEEPIRLTAALERAQAPSTIFILLSLPNAKNVYYSILLF